MTHRIRARASTQWDIVCEAIHVHSDKHSFSLLLQSADARHESGHAPPSSDDSRRTVAISASQQTTICRWHNPALWPHVVAPVSSVSGCSSVSALSPPHMSLLTSPSSDSRQRRHHSEPKHSHQTRAQQNPQKPSRRSMSERRRGDVVSCMAPLKRSLIASIISTFAHFGLASAGLISSTSSLCVVIIPAHTSTRSSQVFISKFFHSTYASNDERVT